MIRITVAGAWRRWLLAAGLLILLPCSALAGGDTGGGLAVYVVTDRVSYTAGQPVNVTFFVINDTGYPIEAIEAPGCGFFFYNVRVYDLDGQLVWHTSQCPCLCCPCAALIREIPAGASFHEDVWGQRVTLRVQPCRCIPPFEECGCPTRQAASGYYYITGSVVGVESEPFLIYIE